MHRKYPETERVCAKDCDIAFQESLHRISENGAAALRPCYHKRSDCSWSVAPLLSRGGVNPSMCIRALQESLKGFWTSFESYPKEAPWSHEGFCLMFGWGRAESSRVASVCFSVLEGGLFFRDFDKFLRSFDNSLNLWKTCKESPPNPPRIPKEFHIWKGTPAD